MGGNIVTTISENSPSGSDTNAVQAVLYYPANLLKFVSISLIGPFTICAQNSGGNGQVHIACASSNAQSGKRAIAEVAFKVLNTGAASISMAKGSDIDNTYGTSVWNQALPSASYNLVADTAGQAVMSAQLPQSSYGSISVTLETDSGQKVINATVSLNGDIRQPNKNGTVNFSGVPSGKYELLVKATSYKDLSLTGNLNPGQNKILIIKLTSSSNYVWLYGLLAAVLIVGLGLVLKKLYRKPYRVNT